MLWRDDPLALHVAILSRQEPDDHDRQPLTHGLALCSSQSHQVARYLGAMSERTDGPALARGQEMQGAVASATTTGRRMHPWFATFAVLSECIGGLWRAEPTAVGFRGCAPVVERGRGGSSTLGALDQERSRTSRVYEPSGLTLQCLPMLLPAAPPARRTRPRDVQPRQPASNPPVRSTQRTRAPSFPGCRGPRTAFRRPSRS
jgi:hypothetical protein